jgi:pilus assembly protein Flp/PilA
VFTAGDGQGDAVRVVRPKWPHRLGIKRFGPKQNGRGDWCSKCTTNAKPYESVAPGVVCRHARVSRRWYEEIRMKMLKRLWKEEEGQDLVEYALLIALIALVAASTFPQVANAVKNVLGAAVNNLSVPAGGGS